MNDTTTTAPTPRYALYPQHVLSRSDRQSHFIDARTLCALYGVRIEDCLVVRTEDFGRPDKRELLDLARQLIPLKPRYDGKYQLPEPIAQVAPGGEPGEATAPAPELTEAQLGLLRRALGLSKFQKKPTRNWLAGDPKEAELPDIEALVVLGYFRRRITHGPRGEDHFVEITNEGMARVLPPDAAP